VRELSFPRLSRLISEFSVMGATGAGKSSVRVPDMGETCHLQIYYDLSS
jgi:hypothetical protein